MRLIGLHGKARSGKDEFCNILCKTFGFKRIGFADKIKEFAVKYFEADPETLHKRKTKESRKLLQNIGFCVREQPVWPKHLQYPKYIIQNEMEHLLEQGISGHNKWVEKFACEYFGIEEKDLKRRAKKIINTLNGIQKSFTEGYELFENIGYNNAPNIWIEYLFNTCKKEDIVYIISDVRLKNEKEMIEKYGVNIKIIRTDNPDIEAGKNDPTETELKDETNWYEIVVNEHKDDWQERLALSSVNLVRKLENDNFFTDKDLEKFKIRL